jgi:carbamoyl-phosphate synthase large subunit
MNGKRVFVSGGAGVIGLEMIPKLSSRGAIVMVGDLKSRPTSFPREVIYRQGDLNEMSEREMRQFAPDIFIHLAATFERSAETYSFWEENFLHNVQLSHHMMSLVKDQPTLKRVVFASSYLIYEPGLYQFSYPSEGGVSLRESDPVQPRNLTGMAKFAHEIELKFINQFRASHFSTVCARIFRGYGRNSRDVISRWIRSLLDGETIAVYRGEGLFDYIYAADSAEGLIRLAEKASVTGIINLGTGQSRRVNEVVDILHRYFPAMKSVNVEIDIPFEASQAEMSRFSQLVGWVPEYNLEAAIPEIIAFEKDRKAYSCNVTELPPPVVLVSSASRKVPLVRAMKSAACRIDRSARLVAGDMSAESLAAYVADEFWVMPATTDEMLDKIIDGCRARGINIILPTRDGELQFWARHAEYLAEHGINVIVSSVSALSYCIDKQLFSDFGAIHGLPVIPSSANPKNIESIRYVVKERYGSGSREIGIDLDLAQAIVHATTLEQPIFQPYIMGLEFSVDAWVDSLHRVKGLVLRRRDAVVNGESQITTTFTNSSIEEEVRMIIEVLKLRGPVVLQAIQDSHGELHVIECNARFGGASTAGIEAGVDSFFWSILEARGSCVDDYPFIRSPGELRQVRLPADIYTYDSNF